MPFGITTAFERARREDHGRFYCPAGHWLTYPQDSEVEKLRKQVANAEKHREWADSRARAARDQADAAERRRRAAKVQLTKVKKRIAAGVCPCCNRSFVDLARHMAGQHPDYAGAPAAAGITDNTDPEEHKP